MEETRDRGEGEIEQPESGTGQPAGPWVIRDGRPEQLRAGSLGDELDKAGWDGTMLYGYAHCVRRFDVRRSERHPELGPAIEAARSHARAWTDGGMSRRLYRSVDAVVSYHGVFTSHYPWLRKTLEHWAEVENRAGAIARLQDLSREAARHSADAQARHDELGVLRADVVQDTGQLNGILSALRHEASPEYIAEIQRQVDFQAKLIDLKNDSLRTEQELIAGLSAATVVTGNLGIWGLIALGFELWQMGEAMGRANTLSKEVAEAVRAKREKLNELGLRSQDGAYAKAVSGPIGGLVDRMQGATTALRNEIARWQRLTTELDSTATQLERAVGGTEGLGRAALRRLLVAKADWDDVLLVAERIKQQLTPPIQEIET